MICWDTRVDKESLQHIIYFSLFIAKREESSAF